MTLDAGGHKSATSNPTQAYANKRTKKYRTTNKRRRTELRTTNDEISNHEHEIHDLEMYIERHGLSKNTEKEREDLKNTIEKILQELKRTTEKVWRGGLEDTAKGNEKTGRILLRCILCEVREDLKNTEKERERAERCLL